jgi:FKBP-type peptidyl-prolyl cis-trans isomerase FklB
MATENQLSLGLDEQKVSYGLGRQFGDHLLQTHIVGIDLEAVIAGMEQAYMGQSSVISAESLESAYQSIETKLKAAARERAGQARQQGEDFLAKNRRKNNIVTLTSGLQYQIIEKGSGEQPGADARVRTHYHGMLLDGTVFDSSIERDEPAEFGVNQVIAGWTEALQLMRVGSHWRLYIPPALAYGDQGAGADIPPHATLIFDVKLLSILDN